MPQLSHNSTWLNIPIVRATAALIAVAVALALALILGFAIGRGFKDILFLGTRLASLPQPHFVLFLLVAEHGFEIGYSVPGWRHLPVDGLEA